MTRKCVLTFVLLFLSALPAFAQGTREVPYGPRTVVPIHAKLRFTTVIVLPEDEEVLDFVCGDKDYWVVSGTRNLAYIKPAKAGASTNLNLITASGQIYSFVLTEGQAEPDLKVFVVPDAALGTAVPTRRLYSEADVEALRAGASEARQQAADARTAAAQAVEDAAAAKLEAAREADLRVDAFRAGYPSTLRFPYRFKAHARPFGVTAIFHDGRFTYIRAEAAELPALYEIKDGQPALVTFQVEDGLYIVPKVLERAYLAVGKQRLTFEMAR